MSSPRIAPRSLINSHPGPKRPARIIRTPPNVAGLRDRASCAARSIGGANGAPEIVCTSLASASASIGPGVSMAWPSGHIVARSARIWAMARSRAVRCAPARRAASATARLPSPVPEGSARAARNLARLSLIHISKDPDQAIAWLHKAADHERGDVYRTLAENELKKLDPAQRQTR